MEWTYYVHYCIDLYCYEHTVYLYFIVMTCYIFNIYCTVLTLQSEFAWSK